MSTNAFCWTSLSRALPLRLPCLLDRTQNHTQHKNAESLAPGRVTAPSGGYPCSPSKPTSGLSSLPALR